MPKTLVTGATGFIGSHVARRLAARGDEVRATTRADSSEDALSGLECERVRCDLLDRRAVRRALDGVARVFHSAGLTSLRRSDDQLLFRVNVDATRILLEECLAAGVERVTFTSSVAAIGPAPEGQRGDERQVFTAGSLGIPYVNSKHEAEVEALRIAAHGLPVVCVNPCVVFGAGDVYGGSTSLVRRFLLGRIPAYVDGGINIVDVDDVAAGHLLADEAGVPGERYVLAGRNYTIRRLFADLGRISGSGAAGDPAAGGGRAEGRAARRACSGAPAHHRERGEGGEPVVDLQRSQGEARARLERPLARGDARGDGGVLDGARRRSHQAVAVRPAASVQARRPGAREPRRRGWRRRTAAREGSLTRARPSDSPAASYYPRSVATTLYRCKTPTDYFCPCGRVARRLRYAGIEYDEVRVAVLQRDRPEMEALTGQRWVPVLVHGDEVIHDSRRIIQYVEAIGRATAGATS